MQMTCNGGTCTVNASDDNNSGNYSKNLNPAAGTTFSVVANSNGRAVLIGTNNPIILYLYDSSASGGGVTLHTDGVRSGNFFTQGTANSPWCNSGFVK
jgi:hypothetical protein